MNRIISCLLFVLLLSATLSGFVYATATDRTSNSPPDEWWMHGGNISYNRYALSNAPANLTNATIISQTFAYTIGTPPLVVGDLIYLLPTTSGSSRYFILNASNISQFYENSSGTYSLAFAGGPTYYNGSLYHHTSSGGFVHVNASNISQTLGSVGIADGIYYASPTVRNDFVYIGDGNSAPRFREYNLSNISHNPRSYTTTGRIYSSSPFAGDYVYIAETSQVNQVNASNISQARTSVVACAANGIDYSFPASNEYVYKTCTVNSVNILQQFNASNISRVIANFSNGSLGGYALGNGFLYFGSSNNVYQVNASNVTQLIANFTTYTGTSASNPPLVNRDYLFISAGAVMYQLDANNISRLVSNFTAAASISSSATLARGFLYFGAGTRLYQMGTYSRYSSNDTTAPSVTLNSPAPLYVNDTSNPMNVSFDCSATDGFAVSNLSLYITNNANQSMSRNQTLNGSGVSLSANWNVSLVNGNYTWNCLAVDSSNNQAFAGTNRTIILNFTDEDGDGVPDSRDTLRGNSSNVTRSGIASLNVTIGGTNANGTFSDTREVVFYDGSDRLANFSFNFSGSSLDLSRISITKGTYSIMVNFSGQVQTQFNKTLYIQDQSFDSLCVKDSEISSISEMSSNCTGSNETDISACIGSGTPSTFGTLSCVDSGNTIAISNLRYSAVRGTIASTPVEEEETQEEERRSGGDSRYIYEVSSGYDYVKLRFLTRAGIVLNKTIMDAKSTGVKEFEIVSKDWLTGDITIRNYDQLPEKCIIENGEDMRFYKALDFEHSFSNDKVQETRVRIGIDKKWIKENNISEIDVVRCYPKYERLRASYVSETESEGLYDVYSEGFSTFAILGTYKASSLEIPILEKQLPYFWIILWVVVAVLLIAFVVVLRKKHMSLTEDVHMKNKWFDFEWKMKLKFNSTPPHQRKFEPH